MTTVSSLQAANLKKSADTLLHTAVANGTIPGVAAAATTSTEAFYQGGFGVRAQGLATAMDLDTVMWIASMTKPLVGTAAMQLVEQGRLNLDEPAARVVPDIDRIQVIESWGADGQPVLRKPKRQITLRHLLTHTAGFTSDIWSANSSRYLNLHQLPRAGSGQRRAIDIPLSFDPGERWEYGINIDWVGLMVSSVTGLRLGEYIQKHIAAPLGMSSTGFKITPDMRARLAKVHQRDAASDTLTVLSFEVPQETEIDPGGGGM